MEKLKKTKAVSRSNLITFSAKLHLPPPYNKFISSTDVRIPAGYPPIRLKEIKTVGEAKRIIPVWCHNLRLHFLEVGQWLSLEAICYFLSYEYEVDSKKYTGGCKIIQGLADIERK